MPRLSLQASFLLVAATLAAQDAPVAPRAPAAPVLHWETEVDAAFKKARELGRPVLFVIMKDKEIGCRRMLDEVWAHPRVIEKAASFVLLPASVYMHVPVAAVVDGATVETCPEFRGVSCAQHQSIEKEMHARYFEQPEVIAPQHLFCDGDGRVIERKEYELRLDGLLGLMDAVLRKHRGEDPAAAPPVAADAAVPPAGELSAEADALLREIASGPLDARKDATRKLLESTEEGRARRLVDLVLDPKVFKSDKDAGEIVRVLGYPKFAHAAKELCRVLDARSAWLRNCTVVTLEEMASPEAAAPLLELWKKEKDADTKKDILRALGPTAAGNAEAREVLKKNLSVPEERRREAAAMSLGYFLAEDETARADLKARYRKESGKGHVKVAILHAYRTAGSSTIAGDIKEMQREERHTDLLNTGEIVAATLEGREPEVDFSRGGGRRGGGGRGPGGGAMMLLFRMFGPLYADDRIPRHAITEIMERFRNWGGGDGR